MQDVIREACEAVQATAPRGRAAIRRRLTAEFQARDFSLPPELLDVLVKRLAAGTYDPGEPLVSVHRTGLLRLPFVRQAIRHAFEQAPAGLMSQGVVRVTEHLADVWPLMSRTCPHPPGRDLYAPAPDQVPPPARLIPDPDLRERMPELFEPPEPPPPWPGWSGMPPAEEAELVFVWLEDSGGAVAVCHQPGRIGALDAGAAGAYLPLVRYAHQRDMVVAATADIRVTAHGLLPATVRVVPDRSGPAA